MLVLFAYLITFPQELLANTVGVLLGRTDDQISDITGVATRTKAYDVISWETISV